MRVQHRVLFPLGAFGSLAFCLGIASGCGSNGDSVFNGHVGGNGNGNGNFTNLNNLGGGADGGGADGGPPPPRCIVATQQCVDNSCGASSQTSISGTVYDPAGNNPLYGIVAYVPSVPPSPITPGAQCLACNQLYTGNPIAFAVTDPAGHFTIRGVPDGANIPLVIQVGKWRMQYTIPNVSKCSNNDASSLIGKKLKLPNNHTVGDIPAIGIATGGADSLECLLHRIGVDETEYGAGAGGTGRIHIYYGDGGSNTTPAAPNAWDAFWDKEGDLKPYDIVLLTCEGHETTSDGNTAALTAAQLQALYAYANNDGGRVFASHFHYAWFNTGPFGMANLATWTPGTNDIGTINANILTTLPNGQPFPRGVAMDQWLMNVGALGVNGAPPGELNIVQARHNADVSAANTPSVPWIVADKNTAPTMGRRMTTQNAGATEYFSFDTPLAAPAVEQCGRVVYSDLHVGAASGDYGGYTSMGQIPMGAAVPSGCANNQLSPQEKALEFMLFDLSGCITPSNQGAGGVPTPPPQ
jgi:hypothetical protein